MLALLGIGRLPVRTKTRQGYMFRSTTGIGSCISINKDQQWGYRMGELLQVRQDHPPQYRRQHLHFLPSFRELHIEGAGCPTSRECHSRMRIRTGKPSAEGRLHLLYKAHIDPLVTDNLALYRQGSFQTPTKRWRKTINFIHLH